MDPHHRKIDLQSPSDLTYLLRNVRAVAQQKLDLAIPPAAAPPHGEDAFRTAVDALVQRYVTHTLALALPSLSVNGLDASPSLLDAPGASDPSAVDPNDPSYEPYDPELATRVRTLHATLDAETTRVAELRREAPGAAARAYVERIEAELEEDDRAFHGAVAEVRQEASGARGLGVNMARQVEVEASWTRGLEGLSGLNVVTETVARLERALNVMSDLERR